MRFSDFAKAITYAENVLLRAGQDVDAGSWQGYKTEGKPDLMTKEILNLTLEVPVYRPYFRSWGDREVTNLDILASEIQPNLPWANDHFAERVSRDPSNPGEEYKNWPWWRGQEGTTQEQGRFTHTYQERFWPKQAGDRWQFKTVPPGQGIRYEMGDLDDVVELLLRTPFTRQAYLPIYFPEDTGAIHGGRTPCTLGYGFACRRDLRNDLRLHMWYHIRSCDLVRHFRDDLYLACRLLLWVLEELELKDTEKESGPCLWGNVRPGNLYFTAYSFHVHYGDLHHVTS